MQLRALTSRHISSLFLPHASLTINAFYDVLISFRHLKSNTTNFSLSFCTLWGLRLLGGVAQVELYSPGDCSPRP